VGGAAESSDLVVVCFPSRRGPRPDLLLVQGRSGLPVIETLAFPLEAAVIEIEGEQLGAAQSAIREQRQQQTVALPLAGVHALPNALAAASVTASNISSPLNGGAASILASLLSRPPMAAN
jgi:hypothetical protein